MKARVFIGTRAHEIECRGLKRIRHEGKEYNGFICDKSCLSLKELEECAAKMGVDIQKVTLFSVELFG